MVKKIIFLMLLALMVGCSSKIENKMSFLPVDKELQAAGYTIVDRTVQHNIKHIGYSLADNSDNKYDISIEEYITTEDALNQMTIEKSNREAKAAQGTTTVIGKDGFKYLHTAILHDLDLGDHSVCTLTTLDDTSTFETVHSVSDCVLQKRRFLFYITKNSDEEIDFSKTKELFTILLSRIA